MRAQEPTASTFSSLTFSTLCTHFLVENQWKMISNHFLIMKPKGFLLSSQTPFCSRGRQSGVSRVSCPSAVPSVSQVLNTGSFGGFSFLPVSLLIEFQIINNWEMYVPDSVLRNYSEKELFFSSSNLTGHPVFLAKSGSPVLGSSISFLHYTSSWFSVALSFILSHSLIISLLPPSPTQ